MTRAGQLDVVHVRRQNDRGRELLDLGRDERRDDRLLRPRRLLADNLDLVVVLVRVEVPDLDDAALVSDDFLAELQKNKAGSAYTHSCAYSRQPLARDGFGRAQEVALTAMLVRLSGVLISTVCVRPGWRTSENISW